MVTFDSRDPGTASETWLQDPRFARLAPVTLGGFDAVVVLAAHPDDESLGAGGLIARAVGAGARVRVVVVTDGAAPDPALARTRAAEVKSAVRELGATAPVLLRHADGRIREERAEIAHEVRRLIESAREAVTTLPLLVAPWRGDGHRDHRVLGEIASEVAGSLGLTLWEYPIWMWHWASPGHPDVPWRTLRSLALSQAESALKQRALGCYPSQTVAHAGKPPMLHPRFLAHFARPTEFFITS